MTTLLEATGVTVRFAGLVALDDVSLSVHRGEILAVIGPNGAGKTTLFNSLTGFVTPQRGRIRLRGEDVTRLAPPARVRRGLGRTFQQGGLWQSETALANLLIAQQSGVSSAHPSSMLAAGRRQRLRERDRVAMAGQVLRILGLERFANTPARALPYGSRKILELGCALVTRPDVLLLDEPAAGTSGEEGDWLAEIIRGIRDELGVTLMVIEHHVALVKRVADRVYVLNFGQLLAEGTPEEVTSDPAVLEAYLGKSAHAARKGALTARTPRGRRRPSTRAGR